MKHLNSEPLSNNWRKKIFCQTKWKIEQTETVREPKKEHCMYCWMLVVGRQARGELRKEENKRDTYSNTKSTRDRRAHTILTKNNIVKHDMQIRHKIYFCFMHTKRIIIK